MACANYTNNRMLDVNNTFISKSLEEDLNMTSNPKEMAELKNS